MKQMDGYRTALNMHEKGTGLENSSASTWREKYRVQMLVTARGAKKLCYTSPTHRCTGAQITTELLECRAHESVITAVHLDIEV